MIRSMSYTGMALAALGAATLAAAAPAPASTTSSSQAQQDAAGSSRTQRNRSDRQICVREQQSGSHVFETVCKTRAQWEAAGGVPGEE